MPRATTTYVYLARHISRHINILYAALYSEDKKHVCSSAYQMLSPSLFVCQLNATSASTEFLGFSSAYRSALLPLTFLTSQTPWRAILTPRRRDPSRSLLALAPLYAFLLTFLSSFLFLPSLPFSFSLFFIFFCIICFHIPSCSALHASRPRGSVSTSVSR